MHCQILRLVLVCACTDGALIILRIAHTCVVLKGTEVSFSCIQEGYSLEDKILLLPQVYFQHHNSNKRMQIRNWEATSTHI